MANGQSDTVLDWSRAPLPKSGGPRAMGGQTWSHNAKGVFLSDSSQPFRSDGEPKTIRAILAAYGSEIHEVSIARKIPPELIVMTIATETGIFRNVNFTGPKTFRWEPKPVSYSGGPMQVLETTARHIIDTLKLDFAKKDVPPHFSAKPAAPPSDNPLYDGDINILLGTCYIGMGADKTELDPILVAAAYNAGSVRTMTPTQENPWGLVTHGDHLNRSARWYGDACAVLSEMRAGRSLDIDEIVAAPAEVDAEDTARESFVRRGLTREEATDQADDYRDSGATVIEAPEEGGLFTLVVRYPQAVADPTSPSPAPVPASGVQPPDQDGYVICIDRKNTQQRGGKNFQRTIGVYQAFFNRQPIPGMNGNSVERQGPGDNSNTGVQRHSRLTQGTYPLFTHAGGSNKYRTFGFANPGGLQSRPWPSIRIGNTSARTGVLIHCAAGYLMSIGCINLTGRSLTKAIDDIEFFDSRGRVIGLIQSMKTHLGNQFPSSNNARIPNAALVIRGEP